MAFDKIVISIPGRMTSTLPAPPSPREVLDQFRGTLGRRAHNSAGMWSVPGQGQVRFDTSLRRPFGTILRANLRTTWADDTHDMMLTLTVNPTRTLIHALTAVEDVSFTGAWLDSLPPSTFFASTRQVTPASTLDGNDNAFADLVNIATRMGADHPRGFLAILERQLRAWALDAVAPHGEGFNRIDSGSGPLLVGDNGVHRVALDWGRLFIRSAEIYCERRMVTLRNSWSASTPPCWPPMPTQNGNDTRLTRSADGSQDRLRSGSSQQAASNNSITPRRETGFGLRPSISTGSATICATCQFLPPPR